MENKNYYEWLEISKNASPEVIEKAYKALVKKYHPDLQEESNKQEAEETLKHITEAYSILSDPIKRESYDATLKNDTVSKEDYDKLQQELNNIKRNTTQNQSYNSQVNQNHVAQSQVSPNQYNQNQPQEDIDYKIQEEQLRRQQEELQYRQQVEAARQKAYHDAYIQDLKNRGYKIRYKKTLKDYIRIIITVVAIIIIFIILWNIPFVKNWFTDLYNTNEILKFVVDFFVGIVEAFFGVFK